MSGDPRRRPQRIRLRRQRDWRKPAGAIVVARPSKWGNPFVIGPERSRADAVAAYERALVRGELDISIEDVRRELPGRDLACWCPEHEPCHADVLLRVANDDERSVRP